MFESKGRTSTPSGTDLADAKTQAGRATHVGTHGVLSGIALASCFTDADALRVRWEDPDPKEEGENPLANHSGPSRLGYDESLQHHYRPIIELAEAYPDAAKRWAQGEPINLTQGRHVRVGIPEDLAVAPGKELFGLGKADAGVG